MNYLHMQFTFLVAYFVWVWRKSSAERVKSSSKICCCWHFPQKFMLFLNNSHLPVLYISYTFISNCFCKLFFPLDWSESKLKLKCKLLISFTRAVNEMFSSKSKNVRIRWVIFAFQASCRTWGRFPADLLEFASGLLHMKSGFRKPWKPGWKQNCKPLDWSWEEI